MNVNYRYCRFRWVLKSLIIRPPFTCKQGEWGTFLLRYLMIQQLRRLNVERSGDDKGLGEQDG